MTQRPSHLNYYSELSDDCSLANPEVRKKKAEKIIAVLQDYAENHGFRLDRMTCLDIGCSVGLITRHLSGKLGAVVGVDPDLPAIRLAHDSMDESRPVKFAVSDGDRSCFPSESFDVVVCNHVYEHVPDAEKLFDEIFRLLKRGGICYFSAGNKYMIMEPHYKLPFLSWLPAPLANRYLKWKRGVEVYSEMHFSYWDLKRKLKRFRIVDYTVKVIKDPKRFHLQDMISKNSPVNFIPKAVLKTALPLIPNFIWILEKPDGSKTED